MPSKNSIKEFYPDALYHIYNRGVEKRLIFCEPQDYSVFLLYLKTYIFPKDEKGLKEIISDSNVTWSEKDKALKLLRLNNFADNIQIISYCLIPNHFHLLIKQKDATAIDQFMNSLCTRYVMYFNRKYKRVGVLFQDRYKAVRITSDEQLLHLSRYIHRNPDSLLQGAALQTYQYSSYPVYLRIQQSDWIASHIILDYFHETRSPNESYQSFVEGYGGDQSQLASVLIEDGDS